MATVHATNLKSLDAKILMRVTSTTMQQRVTKALATSAVTAAWLPTLVILIQRPQLSPLMRANMSRALDA